MATTSDELIIRKFLHKNHDFIKNECNFQKIATDLLQLGVITKGECDTILRDPDKANQWMYLNLLRDISLSKLLRFSEALEKYEAHENNLKLAASIRETCKYIASKSMYNNIQICLLANYSNYFECAC